MSPAIDAPPETAREKQPRRTAQQVEAYDFRKAGQFGGKQFQSLSSIHESFARSLSLSLGASLRTSLEVAMLSIEPNSYEQFLQQSTESSYFAAVALTPLESPAAIELDAAIAFPMLDLLLGGEGKPEEQLRPLTEIEEQILESVMKMVCHELQSLWKPLMGTDVRFERRLRQPQSQSLMPGNERIVVIQFEIAMGEARGFLKLLVPSLVTNGLLRRMSQQHVYRARPTPANKNERLQERLQDAAFRVELVLANLQASLRELVALTPGKVLSFRHRVTDPAMLLVSGKGMFSAYPVASGKLRAAQILKRTQILSASERNCNDGQ